MRLYEARPGGPIMRSTWINGKEDRKSLGHRDRELATRQAYELLQGVLANEQAIEEESVTLGMLARLYLDSPQHAAKRERTRRDDKHKLDRVVAFLGADRNILSLSESDVHRYTLARRQGDVALQGVKACGTVRDRTIEADLLMLHRALNWGQRERTSTGRRLLKENPWHGIRLPRERNPRRPLMSHTTYLKLLEVADQVHPLLKPALVAAEGTGRRISAWRNLRWDDIDFQAETIRWRAEHDKSGFEDVRPMSEAVQEALREARKRQRAIGSAPVFPAPKDPTRPCDRHLLDNWLRRAFQLAKLKPEPGGLWHTLRRKWATERKGYPVKDVAAAGGWRDERTILTSYQQADAATIRQVVLHPTQRLVSG
ncbi:MAG: tyrosine-type recombinase/integrase [Gemmatimonadetes bacterium]|nr:tyrosine-type recombinase/integrase [Gemmatimonadota bacterium]